MPSEINAMSSTSEQEKNAEESNEQSAAVITFSICQDPNESINTDLSSINNDKSSQISGI